MDAALRRLVLERENRRYRQRLEHLVEKRTPALNATIRKLGQTKEALRQSEERYRSLFQRIPLGLFRTTPEGRILDANQALVEMLGFERKEDLLRTNAASLYLDPAQRLRWKLILERTGLVQGFQKELRRRDGSIIWVEDNTRAIRDRNGRVVCLEGSVQEITERKRTELALRESQASLREMFEDAPVGYLEYDRCGQIVRANRTYLHMLGYESAEILGRKIWEFFPDAEPGRTQVMAKLAGTLPPARGAERLYRRKDGSILVTLIQDRFLYGPDGTISGVRCTVQDITERKRMEEELRVAHQEKELLFSAISAILIGMDHRRKITEWNEPARLTFGIARQEAVGRSFEQLPISWDNSTIQKAIDDCLGSKELIRLDDVCFKRADGKDALLGLTFNPIPGGKGILILGVDITERRLLERQLAQAQKLESIGQLAAGIAHEINTPIQYVGDNVVFLKKSFEDLLGLLERIKGIVWALDFQGVGRAELQGLRAELERADLDYLRSEIPMALEQTLEGVHRVAAIVRAMKEFSHPGKRENTAVDINRALESTITVSKNEWKYVAELVTDLAPDLPSVHCDAGELNQVFLNIIVNAAQAIGEVVNADSPQKGTIKISTRREGSWVEVRIQDTGPGIPEAIRSRVFDPFFTTKEVGKGTGQGLALCHSVIVKKLKGSISFETEAGKGTTFVVRLPAWEDNALHQEKG